MNPSLPARAHAIFCRTLRLDRAERSAMVTAECGGDTELEAKVRRLLEAADRSDGFLERPALASAFEAPTPVPDAVGNYLVVGVLGVGGMATVYEAQQENPSRRVALKVMHNAMSGPAALERFRSETQALARLHHPGIAQIYEAGAAQLGRPSPSPFFAMELVEDALTITAYADRHALTIRQRVALFASVCDAVLHGHQRGIIHRDLKPGNVLVGPDGLAKVIDFGIARTADSEHTDESKPAGSGRDFAGTLSYMSPEQCAAPGGVDIDVRTDVYSLGVMLFELVTGRLPHDLSKSSITESIRIITHDPLPTAGSLCPQARGDLEAIIAKALEKDPARRYSGAGALAADLRRWLDCRPVDARPSSTLDHLRKFARRSPPLAAAVAALLLMVVAGVILSGRLAYVATRARDAALQRERDLQRVTAFQKSLLDDIDVAAMGDRLRESFLERVRRAAEADLTLAGSDDALARVTRLASRVNFTTLAIRSLNESVLQHYAASINAQFADQPELRAQLLQQLATTMNALGLAADAEPVLRQALALRQSALGPDHADTLQSAHALGSLISTLGRSDESIALLTGVQQRAQRTLGPDDRFTLRVRSTFAGAQRRRGDAALAERLFAEVLSDQRRAHGDDDPDTLRSLNNLGVAYATQGKYDQAEACWRELVDRRRRVYGEDSPEYRSSLSNLGVLLQDQERFAEARTLIESAVAADRRRLGDAHAVTLVSIAQLASLLNESGEIAHALPLQQECVSGRITTLGPEHTETLAARAQLASLLRAAGRPTEAEPLIREVLETQRRLLGATHPDAIESLGILRSVLADSGNGPEALRLSADLIELARKPLAGDAAAFGTHLSAHGALLLAAADLAAARQALLEAHTLLTRALGPTHAKARVAAGHLAECCRAAHAADPTAGHDAEAAQWAAKAAAAPATAPKP